MRSNKEWIILLCCLLVFAAFPFSTDAKQKTDSEKTTATGKFSAKDEVIYGNLHADGQTKDMYVVNTFRVSKAGKLTDHGDYSGVRNLTDLSEISQTDDTVTFEAEKGEFYYQGELEDKPLPWDLSITYLLDDKKVSPADLAGKSGHLQIQIETTRNKDVDHVFFENYMLQISLTLDPLHFQNIQAPEGTEANEGKDKNITFSVMPDVEEELILSADVSELEMEPIDISAVPANIAMEDPDIAGMTSEMQELADGISEVHDGVHELHDGIASLESGAKELNSGSTAFKNGIQELDNSSGELVEGSNELLKVMKEISEAMENSPDPEDFKELDQLEKLPEGLRDAANEIKDFATDLEHLDDAMGKLPDEPMSDKEMNQLLKVLKDNDKDGNLSELMHELEKVSKEIQNMNDLNQVMPEDATEQIKQMASQLEALADEIETGMDDLGKLDELTELQDGLSSMAQEYETFHNGLISYTDGVHELAVSYKELDEGIGELSEGTSSLESGAAELEKGTQELKEATDDLPGNMQSEIDELLEEYDFSDFEPASFVSDKNTNVDVVQFVLQTEKIEVDEPETSEKEPKKKSLWDRFLDLFRN